MFTKNNPDTSEDGSWDLSWPDLEDQGARYLIYQLERGQEGTLHWQGYIAFKTMKSFNQVRDLLPPASHIEKARGNAAHNQAYCSKEETRQAGPWEFGEIPAQGKRTDLQTFVEDMKEQPTMTEVQLIESHTGVVAKYPAFVDRVRSAFQPKRTWETIVHLYWGAAGTGKTRRANEEAGPDAYRWMPNTKGFFDGYNGQDVVIFDDYDGDIGLKFELFLQILDRYPLRVEVKGSSVNWKPRHIYITSQVNWDDWYPQKMAFIEKRNALKRRIHHIVEFVTEDSQIEHLSYDSSENQN